MTLSSIISFILGQLVLYINGQLKDTKDKQEKTFESDTHTKLTLGKPNHIDKHFGRFKMDMLAIFYYQLTLSQIEQMSGRKCINFSFFFFPPSHFYRYIIKVIFYLIEKSEGGSEGGKEMLS